jgi:hypothetical protein
MPAPPGQVTPRASRRPEQAIRPEWPILRGPAKPSPSLPERERQTA